MPEEQKRRTDRVLAPVRIRVIGNDVSGVSFSEETITVSFSPGGARISLTHPLLPDDIILIKNLANDIEEEFRVVGAFQQVFGDRREWGVEALNPESGIWGIDYTPPREGLQPKVLIECAACRNAIQSPLSTIEYDVLLATGLISRHCERCKETTRWKPSDQPLTSEIIQQSHSQGPPLTERRKSRRLQLVMRLMVRNSWGVTDIAQTRNVSKGGLCFVSAKVFNVGDELFITLPFAYNQAPVETPARVVWTQLTESGRQYGVCYLK
ncbi:MAG: PilZ domain-containing protein [Acidobacteria bacterium]|nr:MAG: PilZ domain-containing protein [Acidobacteriota bacterium]